MKFVIVTLTLVLSFVSNANASGCNWRDQGHEVVGSLTFKATGTLECVGYEDCTFTLIGENLTGGMVLRGPKRLIEGAKLVTDAEGQFKKIRHYGSCSAEYETTEIEVMIEGRSFSTQLSYNQ